MASLMNGLSALGQGVSAFAGTAGLEAQKAGLAQQNLVLADQLAGARESAGRTQEGDIQAAAAQKLQGFTADQATKQQSFLTTQASNLAAAEMARTQATEAGATGRTQMTIDAPSPEIKSAVQFSKLAPDQKQAYREEMMTKAGLPAWMMGGGDNPSPPTGSGAVSDMPGGITPDAGTPASSAAVTGATPPTPDPGATRNDKALETVPSAAASIVRGMVDGRISPPSSFAMSKPYWQGLIAKAAEYDPTFDQTTWAGRVATKKDFASGKSAVAVTALNTALSHAGTLVGDFDTLNNFSFTPANTVYNAVSPLFGSSSVSKATETVDALASEARKVFAASGGGNLTELQEWQKNFPINGSPTQQKAALTGFVELLDGRLQGLADQYNRGMGRTDDPLSLLQPKARAVYEKLTGREPTNATGYQMGTPPAGGTPAPAAAASPAAAIPSWVKPGDQYSPSRGQARGADGAIYGAPQ
jgi:hypothetical protein